MLILLLAVSTLTCTDLTTKDRVVIGEVTWDGGLVIAHVLKTVLETKLGIQVELVLADQPVIVSAMQFSLIYSFYFFLKLKYFGSQNLS